MAKASKQTNEKAIDRLLSSYDPQIQRLARKARTLGRKIVPDAAEEVDPADKLIALTFTPGHYKGAVLAIAPQKSWVNIMFSRGVELLEVDSSGLLEGTGKLARHVKIRAPEQLDDPALRALIEAAAARTPRS